MNHPKQAILQALDEMASFLGTYGIYDHEKRFRHHYKILSRNFCLENINNAQSIFKGGMGSFNDLIISKANGHRLEHAEEENANRKLGLMSRKVYDAINRAKQAI